MLLQKKLNPFKIIFSVISVEVNPNSHNYFWNSLSENTYQEPFTLKLSCFYYLVLFYYN